MTKIPGKVARSLRPVVSGNGVKRMNTWQSVRAEVLRRIRSREWPPGELIPTEQQLAVQLGCARATVNRALRELADNGIIERRRKVGTRVTATPSRRTTLEMSVIRDEIEAMGAEYGYRLTSFSRSYPTEEAMRALQVSSTDELLIIKANYTADGEPHCCEAVWLNPRTLPPLTREELEDQPAHDWLARNVPLTQGRFCILAEGATGDCATNLGVAAGTPVLTIERINWSDATPVSFARQFYPPKHRLISED
ncbi:GntR family transcriptional regulator, histidine utilization repressor [Paracoccus seriniphilus]|uniref:GntR family transcriptional regulator, histidine utilization repressor n=3 Tax=Paracoccus seriniphilus TaxID=184748 RepID=A0A239PSL8_9RHOB|nr:UTRA domain-containing protein [Paracoccus seriniphilus]SNT73043.1 GntR family transcriptional regulator, histidine utilization repressor [Paracoccus seriniphilus]